MAYCGNCQQHIKAWDLMTKPLICPNCKKKITFKKDEYKNVTRPGIYIAIALIINVSVTVDPLQRFLLNIIILSVWFAFFIRFVRYLDRTIVEIEQNEGG